MTESNTSETPLGLLMRMEQVSRHLGYKLPEKIDIQPTWRGLVFTVDRWRLLMPLEMITDVVDCGPITPVPRTKPWLRGISNVRGTLYSVTDLAGFLGCESGTVESEGKLLVLRDSELRAAFLVKEVYGLKTFDVEQRIDNVTTVDATIRPYVSEGYEEDDQVLPVLDVDRLINTEQFLGIEWVKTG